jgi:hypothetical protein
VLEQIEEKQNVQIQKSDILLGEGNLLENTEKASSSQPIGTSRSFIRKSGNLNPQIRLLYF